MSAHPRDKASEAVGLLCLAVSVFLIVTLLSHSPLDPSISVSSADRPYQNYFGRVGAWTGDAIFQAVGISAFLLPVPFLLIGFRKVRKQIVEYPFFKLFVFSCLIAAICAVLSVIHPPWPDRFNFPPGGLLGLVISDYLVMHLNRPGSLILLSTVIVLSLVFITRFSVDRTVTWFSGRRLNPLAPLAESYRNWRGNRGDRRAAARIRSEKSPVITRSLPREIAASTAKSSSTVEAEFEDVDELPESGGGSGVVIIPTSPEPPQAPRKPQPRPPSRAESADAPGPEAFRLPPLDFLQLPGSQAQVDQAELQERSTKLVEKYAEFDVTGRVLQINPGPVVTTFEFKPDPGVRYSRMISMSDDLCLALKAEAIRIDRIPGKNTVGVEVPNIKRQTILLREILDSAHFVDSSSLLTLGLGKLIDGNTFVANLTKMPHLLIAGATGSGKSVGLNCIVCSILYKAVPEEVRFIMIDPKRLELGLYEGIPHLLTPIVTDPRQAANALNWAVIEMEERYKLLAEAGVRNIEQYNEQLKSSKKAQDEGLNPLPYIVVIVDELADLMMTAGKEVEASLARLAQMARAIGIHLILATQRPSVDVLTGLIKANFPCRISFRVASKVDSRTILDVNGAEQLLGQGDMLYKSPATSRLVRVHGAYISEKEIGQVTSCLKQQAEPQYREEILENLEEDETDFGDIEQLEDDLYGEAARYVVEVRKASTSLLQRRFRVGYGRAARLLDIMQHEGIVGPPDGSKPREVLVAPDYFDEVDEKA